MRSALVAALVATTAIVVDASSPALADSVTDQLDEARRFYEEGDVAGAITELEFALQELRGKLGERYVATLPEAPAGWEAEAAEQQGGAPFMGGGIMISRRYRRTDGNGSIEAQLVVDNPMIQGFAAMLGNPALLASQPNTRRVRVGRDNAVLQWDPEARSGELTLVLGRAMVQLSGNGLESPDVLVELLKAWDLRTVKELTGM